jgi:hypothetical protein
MTSKTDGQSCLGVSGPERVEDGRRHAKDTPTFARRVPEELEPLSIGPEQITSLLVGVVRLRGRCISGLS